MSIDTAAIERATLAAVPPQAVEELDGFLVGLDAGTVGRARSAVPLEHVLPAAGAVSRIAARYEFHRLAASFRVPRVTCFDPFRSELVARGYQASNPTLTLVGRVSDMAGLGEPRGVEISDAPGTDWVSTFLGEGFDPVDGASRLELLRRSRASVFAGIRVDGAVAAVGSACFSQGWVGVHGMRTVPAQRGCGLATQVLAAIAHQARVRGIDRVFLQVEEANAGALRLYRRAGLEPAWVYDYWGPARSRSRENS